MQTAVHNLVVAMGQLFPEQIPEEVSTAETDGQTDRQIDRRVTDRIVAVPCQRALASTAIVC